MERLPIDIKDYYRPVRAMDIYQAILLSLLLILGVYQVVREVGSREEHATMQQDVDDIVSGKFTGVVEESVGNEYKIRGAAR